MGEDEVATLRALKAHRRDLVDPSIARHHGRIVKTTGDGLLVEFAAASSMRLPDALVSIQRGMIDRNEDVPPNKSTSILRIGINIGDIIIEGGDIFGDGVELLLRGLRPCASRAACASRVLPMSRSATSFLLAFADRGEQDGKKNIARSVGVFGLPGALDIARLPAEAQLEICRAKAQ